MPTLIFRELFCERTKEVKKDEVYINLRTEDIIRVRNRSNDEGNPLWGPVSIEEGGRINYVEESSPDHLESIEFQEFAHIALWEDDPDPRKDNLIGEFTLRRNSESGDNQHIWLPRRLSGPNDQSYLITYDLEEVPLTEFRNRIELLQLNCNNPQGTRDRVELIVNDEILWSSRLTGDMRKGHERVLHNVFYDFHERARVILRETRGQDWLASHIVSAGEDLSPDPLVFDVDSHYFGDARYLLHYRVIQH